MCTGVFVARASAIAQLDLVMTGPPVPVKERRSVRKSLISRSRRSLSGRIRNCWSACTKRAPDTHDVRLPLSMHEKAVKDGVQLGLSQWSRVLPLGLLRPKSACAPDRAESSRAPGLCILRLT